MVCHPNNASGGCQLKDNQVSQIEGVRIALVKSVTDSRGTFVKFHPQSEFSDPLNCVAISMNPIPGTIRGLHFQLAPFSEEKLVTCLQGSILDITVDLREHSETFGKWAAIELSEANMLQAYLPKGIAHGFQTLQANSIVHYSLGAEYEPDSSYSVNPLGELGIKWPLPTNCISDKDASGVSFILAAQKYAESLKN